MDLCVYIEITVKSFDKYHKYTIGNDLRAYAKELLFLIHRANMHEEKIDKQVASNNYWSSSPNVSNDSNAWNVNFNSGNTNNNNKLNKNYVRCVRGR